MRARMLGALGALVLALPACADSASDAAANGLKVDLGQAVTTGIVTPVDGIISAGQPDEAALQVFADSGFGVVVDLRTAGEDRGFDEPAAVEALGMRYVSLPIAGSDGVNLENAARLDELLADFDEPVLLHCGSGNRVGALLALREVLNGAEKEAAIAKGRSAGMTGLERRVREVLESE